MGATIIVIMMLLAAFLAQMLFLAILGTIGLYVASLAFAVYIIFEMVRQTREDNQVIAISVLLSGLSILIPVTMAIMSLPEWSGFPAIFNNYMSEGYNSGRISNDTALLVQFVIWLWVLGGGLFVANGFTHMIDNRRSIDLGAIKGITAFIVVWGVTASPILGWFLGGLPSAILGKY